MELSAFNITRLKNIANYENGKAYLDLDETEFILHFPDRLKNSILDTNTDELIVLYQRESPSKPRYLTHLVRPIDNHIIEEQNKYNFKFGRAVEVVAYSGENNKIPFQSTLLKGIDLRNKGWGNAVLLNTLVTEKELHSLQRDLWDHFTPLMKSDLEAPERDKESYYNDELSKDFSTIEGKELFRLHRIRERDSSITAAKKQKALEKGRLRCEVCGFSFIEVYNQEYIECHHLLPIKHGERQTKLDDLALVCSNCHRMLHRKIGGKYLSIDELKSILSNSER